MLFRESYGKLLGGSKILVPTSQRRFSRFTIENEFAEATRCAVDRDTRVRYRFALIKSVAEASANLYLVPRVTYHLSREGRLTDIPAPRRRYAQMNE